ncbi:class I SAM-dependent methyltransferase [Oricola sp.]|uniref:class I SAM-dependent methyltransferase n=1 Tax=Oricola sp. TaxID=1979950 RepID=UPI003BAD0A68
MAPRRSQHDIEKDIPVSEDLTGSAVTAERMRGLGFIARQKVRLMEWLNAREQRKADRNIRANEALWADMSAYWANSNTIPASMSDYWVLYDFVRRNKPKQILEFGTGQSTVVMSRALMENEQETGERGHITSMEESRDWAAMAAAAMPEHLRPYHEIIQSDKRDGFYKMFRGVCYTSIPERDYDFVFSDGPERHSPVNNDKLFDLDLIFIVQRTEKPITAIVDNHYLTFYVFQKVFGVDKARYDVRKRLMYVGPVNKHDVRHLKKENFLNDLRFFGRSELKLRMALDEEWR